VHLVPVSNGRDLVFDPVRRLLYVTTSDGTVETYDPFRGLLRHSIRTGGGLNGADITPDSAFLYAADGVRGLTQGFVRKVNLTDGSVTAVPYGSATSFEGFAAAWDVAVFNNGKALVTTGGENDQANAVLGLTLATDTFAVRTDPTVFQPVFISTMGARSPVARGADRSSAVLVPNYNWDDYRSYDAAADLIAWRHPSEDPQSWPGFGQPAVSRDGSVYAIRHNAFSGGGGVVIYTKELDRVANLPGLDGGVTFDPVRDTLYGINSGEDVLIAYDTRTWAERYRLPVSPSDRTWRRRWAAWAPA
jgi:hypothetical protein